jgi:signal transduction histidine kinase
MQITHIFEQIKEEWVNSVSTQLTRGEEIREQFTGQAERYFELLEQSVTTGDAKWMQPILLEWAQVRTQTEVEKQEASLTILLNQIFTITHQIASETLEPRDALTFIEKILPIHTESLEFITQEETHAHIEYVSRELENVRLQMEKLDRSKSDFISVAAHELKTPLTLIEGYKDMLGENLPKQDTQVSVLLDGIENGTRRLRDIIEDMIDVSLIDNNLLELNFQPIWLNRLIDILVREYERPIQQRQLTLEVHEFEGLDTMTFGDSERIYQVFRNLLSNAIKYTPNQGQITINGRLLPGFIEIIVEDTGIGIAEKDQDQIFEKFGYLGDSELHSSGKTKFKGGGPGLGLPIAKGIVEAHGGTIWIESDGYDEEACPGTTVHVLFPIHEEPPDEKAKKLFQVSSKTDFG